MIAAAVSAGLVSLPGYATPTKAFALAAGAHGLKLLPADADGFGLGANLYCPAKPAADVARDAATFVSALQNA